MQEPKQPEFCGSQPWDSTRWDPRPDTETTGWPAWPVSFKKPRTCPFCGSIHPEDLLGLLKEGWELESTTKAHKTYWHPPGYRAYHARVVQDIEAHIRGTITPPPHIEPTPPVKLYGNHVSHGMAAEINTILLLRKAMAVEPSDVPKPPGTDHGLMPK